MACRLFDNAYRIDGIDEKEANMSVKASIIIPCFNTEETIARSLREFCNQTVPPEHYQVIVIDDCSTDNTAAQIETVAQEPQITFLQNEQNSGPALTRNRGIDLAEGEIVIFADGDTIPCKNFVAMHIDTHQRYPDPFVGVMGAAAMPEDLEITPLMYLGNVVSTMQGHEFYDDDPYGWLNFSTLNVSLKRAFIGDTRFDDGSFKREAEEDTELAGLEDAEFAQRLAQKGMRLVQNPEIRAFHYHFRSPENYMTKVHEYGKRFALWMSLCSPEEAAELNKRLNYLIDRDNLFSMANVKELIRRGVVNDLTVPIIRAGGKFFETRNEKLSLFLYNKLYKYLFLKGYNSR
ncbi:MAG: glycosyltransferase family 2 protein [Desulfobulbaceae bacterium]|nr:MAG: glycosyltransferase family 2 protein [Desulfobulbaceae bacterium]